MTLPVRLRAVADADLPIFFEQQLDPVAGQMAAFPAKNPADRDAFNAHWMKIRRDPAVMLRTVLADGRVAGYVGSFEERPGKPGGRTRALRRDTPTPAARRSRKRI